MNDTLAKFMKVALTTIVISALIFVVAYKMLADQSDKYQKHIEDRKTEALQP